MHLNSTQLIEYIGDRCNGAPKGIIFDCDGVLIDSVEANMLFYNKVRQKLGLPDLNSAQREYCQMSTAAQALDFITPDALKPLLNGIVREISYAKEIEPMIQASEGIVNMLQNIKEHFLLGVHTNRTGPLDAMLNRLEMGTFFNPIMTVLYCEPKPSPDGANKVLQRWNVKPHEVLFIGDSAMDKMAADAAHIPFMSYRNENLLEIGTCFDYSELEKALLQLKEL